MNKTAFWTATFFGLGYAPKAPGTVASAAVCALYLLVWPATPSLLIHGLFFIILAAVFFLGVWASEIAENAIGHDPSCVVIDEVVGMMIALIMVPPRLLWVLLAFALFRFFDITKILGIRRAEKINGGLGIMLDDVLAGIWSFVFIRLVEILGNYTS